MFREGGEPRYGQMKLDARLIDTPQKGHFRLVARPGPCRAAVCGTSFLMMIAGAGVRLHQLHLLIGPFQALREIPHPTFYSFRALFWGFFFGAGGRIGWMLEPVGIHRLSGAGGTALLLDSGKLHTCIPRANRPTTVLSTCSQPHANTRGPIPAPIVEWKQLEA